MMNNKKISIIMPVYNVASYVKKSIMSVLKQTYKNIELIVVDDGSTDGSREICQRIAELDSRMKLICKQNQGVSAARNDALALAKGEYITFIDSDDWLELDAYEKMMTYMIETNADIVVMGFTPEGDDSFVSSLKVENKKILSCDDALDNLILGRIYTWSLWDKIYKRSLIREISFPTDIFNGEDLLFNWQVFKRADKIAYIPLGGYHYVQRSNSMVNTFSARKLTVLKAFENILIDCSIKDRIKELIYAKYFSIIVNLGLEYFDSNYAKWIGYKFIEIKKIQHILRGQWRDVIFANCHPKLKVAAFMLMLPVPVAIMMIKLYYMTKRGKA